MAYHDITEKVLAAAFDVSNALGGGLLESVYQNAMMIALHEQGLKAEAQVPIRVHYHGHPIGDFIADIEVEKKVILELKSAQGIATEHMAQLIHYLKLTSRPVGMILNFGRQRVQYKRLYPDETA